VSLEARGPQSLEDIYIVFIECLAIFLQVPPLSSSRTLASRKLPYCEGTATYFYRRRRDKRPSKISGKLKILSRRLQKHISCFLSA